MIDNEDETAGFPVTRTATHRGLVVVGYLESHAETQLFELATTQVELALAPVRIELVPRACQTHPFVNTSATG